MEAERNFSEINNELHSFLPEFYDGYVCMCVCMVYVCMCVYMCVSVCLSVCLPVCLSVCLCVCLTPQSCCFLRSNISIAVFEPDRLPQKHDPGMMMMMMMVVMMMMMMVVMMMMMMMMMMYDSTWLITQSDLMTRWRNSLRTRCRLCLRRGHQPYPHHTR